MTRDDHIACYLEAMESVERDYNRGLMTDEELFERVKLIALYWIRRIATDAEATV